MRKTLIAVIVVLLSLPLAAQQKVDFWRVREGSPVTLVLGTGGECKGKVAKRMDGELSIRVSEDSDACGARDSLVTVREENTRTVERGSRSGGKKAALAAAAIGVAGGTGLLAAAVPFRASLGVLGGGAIGTHMLLREAEANRPGGSYVIYVSHLG
jgi:hypothetical protein